MEQIFWHKTHISYGQCFRYWWNAGMPPEPENIYWLTYRPTSWCTTHIRNILNDLHSDPLWNAFLTFVSYWLELLKFRHTKIHSYVRELFNWLHSTHLNVLVTSRNCFIYHILTRKHSTFTFRIYCIFYLLSY